MTTFAVVNPATEETIAELDEAGAENADEAVARAKAAFPAWRAVAPGDRARLLRRVAVLVEEHGEELARIESENVGKPISGARAEVGMVAEVFHFYAGTVDKHHGETIPVAGGVDLTFREPLGIVGLIVPWNFPLNIASWKLGPALACGNTIVLKPRFGSRSSSGKRESPRASSTSSSARARSSGSGSSSIPTWRRSALRAPPRWAAR
jgi:acyl-CoA reductase-like NAD-dependent aldehyde dehydrogenase